MMEDVEKGQMAGLFLQQKYDRVYHVNNFGEIKNPGKIQSSESLRFLAIIHWLALPAVVSGNEKSKILIEFLTTPSGLISDHSKYFLFSYFHPCVNPQKLRQVWKRLYPRTKYFSSYGRLSLINLPVVSSDGKHREIFNILS